jgi:hypothetical protein
MSAMLTRRHFVITSATLFSGALGLPAAAQDRVDFDTTVERPDPDPFANNPWGLHPRFMPTRVAHRAGLTPGDIHVDAVAKYLYKIGTDGSAMRYGVAIGRADLYESGVFTIQRKEEWPSWRPTDNMIEREPDVYGQFADGMPGGPENPLGARALYLYEGGGTPICASTAHRSPGRSAPRLPRAACGWSTRISWICTRAWNSERPRISIRPPDAANPKTARIPGNGQEFLTSL